MSQLQAKTLFPGFAGVALADILANGVAMVIILIVITISVRNAQEEERLEQVQDVSLLLSRELATSVVMNALPTSPPSVLHDYQRSPLDQNLQHSQMPILELHHGGVRNRYNGQFWSRSELLLQDNSLDRYLQSLAENQKLNIRLDVYSIRNFYIAMSVLKLHNIRVPHWHFLGETAAIEEPLLAGGSDSSTGNQEQRNREEQQFAPGEGRNDGKRNQLATGSLRMPAAADWIGGEALPDYPGAEPGAEPGADKSGQSQDQPGQRTMRLRLPTPDAQMSALTLPPWPTDLKPEQIIAALYRFMADIQGRTDAGEYAALARTDLSQALARQLTEAITPEEQKRATALAASLREYLPGPLQGVVVQHVLGPGISALQFDADARQNRIPVLEHNVDDATKLLNLDADASADIQLRMSQWPAIYRGLTIPLHHGGLALVAPSQSSPREWRWRLITLTDATLSDGMIGFVYAAFDPTGKLLLAGEENGVTINGRPLRTAYALHFLRNERMLLMLYGLLAAFIIAMLVRRFRG